MPDLEGMKACSCGCGRQEFIHVLHLTGGVAWECFRDGRLANLREVRIQEGSAIINLKLRTPKRKPGPPRRLRGVDDTRRAAHAARDAARKRLAQLHHDLYDVLLADERRKRGLPIVPKRLPAGAYEDAVASNCGAVVYSAGNSPGVEHGNTPDRP